MSCRHLGSVRSSLLIFSNNNLDTISGFGGLLTVDGELRISDNNINIDFDPLRKLKCHGGVHRNLTLTQQWPQWLLDLPEC